MEHVASSVTVRGGEEEGRKERECEQEDPSSVADICNGDDTANKLGTWSPHYIVFKHPPFLFSVHLKKATGRNVVYFAT